MNTEQRIEANRAIETVASLIAGDYSTEELHKCRDALEAKTPTEDETEHAHIMRVMVAAITFAIGDRNRKAKHDGCTCGGAYGTRTTGQKCRCCIWGARAATELHKPETLSYTRR